MPIVETLLIGVGLSMDAFAVSISNGLCMKKIMMRKALIIAAFFGIFQMIMPTVGYLVGNTFKDFISQFDHILALVFLAFIGGKMLYDGLKKPDEGEDAITEESLTIPKLFIQAIATSIDALMVGVSFVALASKGVGLTDVLIAVAMIGAVTFTISLSGVFAGKKFGEKLGGRAVILGGLILVGIGLKVFIEHTFL